METSAKKDSVVELLAKDLNSHGGVFCPNPSMPLWSSHPRVYLGVAETGSVRRPYCSTVYQLKDGEHFGAGH